MIETYKFIIADIMTKDLIDIAPEITAAEGANTMNENGVSSLVVKENGEVIGIVTDKDYSRQVSLGKDLSKIKIREMMSTKLIFVDPKLSLQEAAEIIRKHNIRQILVKSQAGYVGIVSVKDILSTLYEEIREQNARLNAKIDELEKFYKGAVDRELIMVKLKKRVRELEEKYQEKSDLAEYLVK